MTFLRSRLLVRSSRAALAVLLVASAALLTLPGCDGNKTSDKDVQFLEVQDAVVLSREKSGILSLGNKKVGWVDPRPATKFREERIPGAINIPPSELPADDARLRGFDVLVVYEDRWQWDMSNYLIDLKIELRDARTNRTITSGHSYQTSLARKEPDTVVTKVVDGLLGKEPIRD